MKNFIFLSPNFPQTYWKFCAELKNDGLRVLGIGDCPYDQLDPRLREALQEYYLVPSLEDYEAVFRAVALFTYKYGKIDWLESNNEYWLERDARLRTEFHITTGFQVSDMERVKHKSAMKACYAKAGVPTAPWQLMGDDEADRAFAARVGWPVVVKPDNGVGASHTYRLDDAAALEDFLRGNDTHGYIMEQYVNGEVRTYDAIIGAQGQPLFESGNVTPGSLMDVVNGNGNCLYYIVRQLDPALREIGRRTVQAFGVRSRFVHFEYFVLLADQPGLGKKGDILGLEVNMRPAGGYTPDLFDYAAETDVYKIWADMVAFDASSLPAAQAQRHFCAYCGRRDGVAFRMSHEDIMTRYGDRMMMHGRVPQALSGAMANQMYVANFDTEEELWQFYRELLQTV